MVFHRQKYRCMMLLRALDESAGSLFLIKTLLFDVIRSTKSSVHHDVASQFSSPLFLLVFLDAGSYEGTS
jgi:hypothetical protein